MSLGGTAITPHLNVRDPQAPAFTREDVIAWVSVNPIGRMIALEPPTLVKIEFTTAGDIKNLFHTSTGLLDSTPVCYVEFQGRFDAPHPPGAAPIYTRAWEVFDGRTGNLLMAGGGDR